MAELLIAGYGDTAGKTALACGLGQRWQVTGHIIGYRRLSDNTEANERDDTFVGRVLRLNDGPAVMLMELGGDVATAMGQEQLRAAQAGQATLVVRYQQQLDAKAILQTVRALERPLAGVIMNAVPPRYLPVVRDEVVPALIEGGLPVLGILPEVRALVGFSIGDLAQHLQAEFLCGPEHHEDLIEHLMVGANAADPGFSDMAPQPRTALFCRADRPDLQLTALEKAVRCMVFTGNGMIQKSVVYRAEDSGVPILRVTTDTIDTVRRLSGLAEGVRFRQQGKLPVMQALVAEHLDLGPLESALGI